MILLVALLISGLVMAILAPSYGLLAQLRARGRALGRERAENALKHLLQQASLGHAASFESLQGALRMSDRALMTLAQRLEREGLIRSQGQDFRLTPEGERVALHVLRAHRLWETYLADEIGVPLNQVHAQAERAEHLLSPADVHRLSAAMGHPDVDPHGDPIPDRDGILPAPAGTPLVGWALGTPGRIVHLEDEPPLAFAQLSAEGLKLGQVVRVIDATPTRLVLSDGENEYRLAPMLAGNVHVAPVGDERPRTLDGVKRLSDLPAGANAEVVALDPALRGFVRRRLLDLGFTPGARIRRDLSTFTGDPRAYRLRGTTIALRRDQSDRVLVKQEVA
jgi:DtxR family Mn-dependent transcriptional regulator